MTHVFTVSQLTRAVQEVVEAEFPFVWIQGQVGGVSRPGSGHIYFALKDELATLQVVWFKSNQSLAMNTSARGLHTGMDVLCAGRLTVYPPKGTYQLVAELVQDQGIGRLHLEFEALKSKLSEAGIFAAEHKQPLPSSPRKVAVVSAPGSAALKDFLHLSSGRGYAGEIVIYPTLVQGEGAADNVVAALEEANLEEWAEVIVLIRGGGSLEDLWTFNTEAVARAVFHSAIPVVTGIGHELDLTIADMAADARASTPSHAAQLVWPERAALQNRLQELEASLHKAWQVFFHRRSQSLSVLQQALGWLSPQNSLKQASWRLASLTERLERSARRLDRSKTAALDAEALRLGRCFPPLTWERRKERIQGLETRLDHGGARLLRDKENRLERLQSRLQALDPSLPLSKGYALVTLAKDGSVLRRSGQVAPGDCLRIRLKEDAVQARVIEAQQGPATRASDSGEQ